MKTAYPETLTGDGEVYLESLGAAQTVTGSKHLLIMPGLKIMVDCGLFQGLKSLREKNWDVPPVDPRTIDVLILTHAHLDHCGYIPLLVKDGYRGKIFASRPTCDLAALVLRDSAKLQEEDARKANEFGYSKHSPAMPLYNSADVEACLPQFRAVEPGENHYLNEHTAFCFYPGGHIQGACSVEISCYGKKIVFSGDIGRYHSELLPPPRHAAKADIVVMESTYGDRLHETFDVPQHLAFIINEALSHGGNVLIPCFAVGRAHEMMHILYKLKRAKSIPATVPVYLDSPMAASAGKTVLKYPGWLKISEKECMQMFSSVTINEDYHGTERIIREKGSKIILAASGMLTGGRVLEYLKHYVSDHRNTILIIGYQAEGTRGRALLNKVHEIKIHGRYYPVKANVAEIGGLSAHADQAELISWLKDFSEPPGQVLLVHGEPGAQDAFRIKVKDELRLNVRIMKPEVEVPLFHAETEKI